MVFDGVAEFVSPAHLCTVTCSGNEHFRGDAAYIETVSAHEVALDKSDLGSDSGGTGGGDETGGASSDDDEIIHLGGFGALPVGRVDVGHEGLVVLVQWLDGRKFVDIHVICRAWN